MKQIRLLFCLLLILCAGSVSSLFATSVHLWIRNDLNGGDGGNIGVAVSPNTPVSRTSPYYLTASVSDYLNLAAYDNQTVSGKTWFFNDTEYQDERSEWRYRDPDLPYSTHLSYNASFTNGPVGTSDEGLIVSAYLKTTNYTTSGTMSSDELWFTPVALSVSSHFI